MNDAFPSATKIGTGDFTGRVVSGLIPHDDADSVVLRQLFPGVPTEIGLIDQIDADGSRLTIRPDHERSWNSADRSALAFFFTTRYRDRQRLAVLLGITDLIAEASNG